MSKIQWIKKNFSKREILLVIFGTLIPIALITLLLVTQSNISSGEKKVRELWKTQVLDKYKPRKSNESAQHLEELSSALGIDLVPSKQKGTRPTKEKYNQFKEFEKQFRHCVADQFSKENTSIDPIPQTVSEFYNSHESKIREIVTYLNTHPEPHWAMQVSSVKGPWPNLLGYLSLERLLALDALYSIQKRNYEQVNSTLRSMLRLNRGLLKRPELLSQLISFSVVRYQLGIIRKYPQVITNEMIEVLNTNYAPGFYTGFFCDKIRTSILIMDYKEYQLFYPQWYLKLAAVDLAETNIRRLNLIRSIKTCSEISTEINSIKFARWNRYAQFYTSDDDYWSKYVLLLIDLEFTRRIVDLRTSGQKLSRWPSSLPQQNVTNCPNANIVYQVDGADKAIISIQNVPSPPDSSTALLSRKYLLTKNDLMY